MFGKDCGGWGFGEEVSRELFLRSYCLYSVSPYSPYRTNKERQT